MNVQDITKKAVDHLKNFFPDATVIQLEELDLTDDDKYWNITLSYEGAEAPVSAWMNPVRSRKFKIFKIDAVSGEVRSMKIRELK